MTAEPGSGHADRYGSYNDAHTDAQALSPHPIVIAAVALPAYLPACLRLVPVN